VHVLDVSRANEGNPCITRFLNTRGGLDPRLDVWVPHGRKLGASKWFKFRIFDDVSTFVPKDPDMS